MLLMSRRLSTASSAAFSSTATALESFQNTPASSKYYPRSAPYSKQSNDAAYLDPDELFTKHTVSEVKLVQERLRADADAKQEELRLMVGERYRDLLQASTSIISLASSSQRVLDALEETRDAIVTQKEPPLPVRSSTASVNDKHLRALQVLSVHVKVLLDAPEHLWRLIERRKYFPAAWLFLLARVVHRALVREEEHEEEEAWSNQGVDVVTDFPLVQRQWDLVAQFRPQIIHKATLSLREVDTTAEEICATLVTLHLLDSRPLSETLTTLLSQRSRTLQTMLATDPHHTSHASSTTQRPNGRVSSEKHDSRLSSRRAPMQAIRETIRKALNIISHTVCTSREVFGENDTETSLIRLVLESVQSESPDSSARLKALPSELHLTTQSLLMTFTSSPHFNLLPPNLKAYKPYVDLSSSSSSLQQAYFTGKLKEWLHSSIKQLQGPLEQWFLTLQTVKEIWNVRAYTRKWLVSSKLQEQEKILLARVFDDLCHRRVVDVWKMMLNEAELAFKNRMADSISSCNDASSEGKKDLSPVDYLYQPPPLPTVSQAAGLTAMPLQKYQNALKKQLVGRNAPLDNVLSTVESCARKIHQDISLVKASEGEDASPLVKLTSACQPSADAFLIDLVDILNTSFESNSNPNKSTIDGLIFLGRLADDLSSSLFVYEIDCSHNVVQECRTKMATISDLVRDRWREYTVSKVVEESQLLLPKPAFYVSAQIPSPYPSPELTKALLSLCKSIQQFGVSMDGGRRRNLMQSTFRLFASRWVGDDWSPSGQQDIQNLAFLHKLCEIQGASWSDICHAIHEKLEANLPEKTTLEGLKKQASEYLSRTQTLLSVLLPYPVPVAKMENSEKMTGLLPYGTPSLDQQFHSAIDLAKPSPRFGLLLVGGPVDSR